MNPLITTEQLRVKTLPFKDGLDVLKRAASGNLFFSVPWLAVLDQTYGINLFVKYIEAEGKVRSCIVYSVVKNFLEWKICVCSYCDYCDGHVTSAEDWKLFFAVLRAEYPAYRIAVRNLRDEHVRAIPELKVLSKEKFHILDVSAPIDEVWKRTHDSFRSAVKQGQKSGLTIKQAPRADLQKFYHLHLLLRKNKYRLFAQPFRFFDKIWQEFMDKGNGVLLGAYDKENRFVAGNIYLICGDTLYYKFNTSSLDALNLRPNNLLFWEGIKLAKERNLNFVDLGSSGYQQKGLILFKDHTGARSRDIIHLGFAPPGYKFSQKRILTAMTWFFTRPYVPESWARWGSNVIYPYLA